MYFGSYKFLGKLNDCSNYEAGKFMIWWNILSKHSFNTVMRMALKIHLVEIDLVTLERTKRKLMPLIPGGAIRC